MYTKYTLHSINTMLITAVSKINYTSTYVQYTTAFVLQYLTQCFGNISKVIFHNFTIIKIDGLSDRFSPYIVLI